MFLEPVDLNLFLEELCGTNSTPLLLARDPESPTGWRLWTSEDTEALCTWVSAKLAETHVPHPGPITCYNAKEAARVLGVSVPKFQTWLRRRDSPIPHVRDGRKIVIPAFLLQEWLREEAKRTIHDRL